LAGSNDIAEGNLMVDIVQELTIDATPTLVFEAITAQDQVTLWWANHVIAEPKVGSLAQFSFDNGEVMTMEITHFEATKKVHWLVKQAPQAYWQGTTISWELKSLSRGTKLLFAHRGFAASDRGYEETCSGWHYFLASLKSYLETGKGTPYMYEESAS